MKAVIPSIVTEVEELELGDQTAWSNPASWRFDPPRIPQDGDRLVIESDMNIVLAICFICVGLVGTTGVLMYWRGMKRKRAAQPYKNAKALPDASSPFKNPKSPSPRDGERVALRSGLAATVDVEGLDVMETTVAVSQSTITTSDMDQLDQLTDALEPPGAPPMSPQQRPFHSPSQKARKHRPAEVPSEVELPSGRDATFSRRSS